MFSNNAERGGGGISPKKISTFVRCKALQTTNHIYIGLNVMVIWLYTVRNHTGICFVYYTYFCAILVPPELYWVHGQSI